MARTCIEAEKLVAANDPSGYEEIFKLMKFAKAGGHVLLRMVRTGEVRRLGRWWLDAALDARAAERLGAVDRRRGG